MSGKENIYNGRVSFYCDFTCPNGAISMELSLAAVDSSKCLDCEECLEACMQRAIHFKRKKSKKKVPKARAEDNFSPIYE